MTFDSFNFRLTHMRLHRFYINQKLEKGKELRIENQELVHQWLKVFRMQIGEAVILFDGSGKEFEAHFERLSKNEAVLFIDKENKNANKLKIELHIFQSIIKKDNFELIVQKCTELGVSAIHPVLSERSDQAHSGWARQEKKNLNIERLRKIAIEASEQSGRVDVPEVFEPIDLERALESFKGLSAQAGEVFALDFGAEIFSKAFEKISARPFAIFIGPEGGWTEAEQKLFKKNKVSSISLGSQILRAETAAIAASALILLK